MLKIKSYLVADIILKDPKSGGDVTPLKLFKLAYICHGFHLAALEDSLIEEPIEAWRYGPVVAGLYDAIRHFKGQVVERDFFDVYSTYPKYKDMITGDSKDLISKVLAVYGQYKGGQLSALTHIEGSPWHTVVKEKGYNQIIPNDLIYEYYKRRI